MIDELYINGTKADMKADSGIYLDYKSNLFGDLGKIESSHSYTINLPVTPTNIALTGCNLHVGTQSTFYKITQKAEVKRDGVPIVTDASLYLVKVSAKSIDVVLTWGVSEQLSRIFSDMKLSELFNDTDSITWSKDNNEVTRTYGGTQEFPIAEYGFPYSDITKQYQPVVSVETLLTKIKNKSGIAWSYDSKPWSQSGNSWVIPFLTAKDRRVEEHTIKIYCGFGGNNGEARARMYALPITSNRISVDYFSNTLETDKRAEGDTPDAGDASWKRITLNTKSENVKLTFNGWLQARVVSPTEIDALAMTADFGLFTEDSEGTRQYQSILSVNADYIVGKTFYSAEKEWRYDVRFTITNEDASVIEHSTIDTADSRIYIVFRSNTGAEIKSGHTMKGELTFEAVQEPLAPNNEYYFKDNAPDMLVKDFLKSILGMSGKFMYLQDGTIFVSSYKSLVNSKRDAVDWSNYLITGKDWIPTIEYKVGKEAKNNLLTYKDGEDYDGWNGKFIIANSQLPEEQKAVELAFNAYRNRDDEMVIKMYKYNNGDLEYNAYEKPVIGNIVMKRNPSNNRLEAHLVSTGLSWRALMSNLQEYINILQDVKVINEEFRIDAVTLSKLDMQKPVYLKQYGAFFAILEVKTKANDIAEVKLIKI